MEMKLSQALNKAVKLPQMPKELFTLQRKQMEQAADFSRIFWSHQREKATK